MVYNREKNVAMLHMCNTQRSSKIYYIPFYYSITALQHLSGLSFFLLLFLIFIKLKIENVIFRILQNYLKILLLFVYATIHEGGPFYIFTFQYADCFRHI